MPLFLGLEKTISIPSYQGLVFKTANKDTSNTFIIFNSVNFIFFNQVSQHWAVGCGHKVRAVTHRLNEDTCKYFEI